MAQAVQSPDYTTGSCRGKFDPGAMTLVALTDLNRIRHSIPPPRPGEFYATLRVPSPGGHGGGGGPGKKKRKFGFDGQAAAARGTVTGDSRTASALER